MGPNPRRRQTFDSLERWCPPRRKDDNVLRDGPTLRRYWACNGQEIREVPAAAVPKSAMFRTYSVYHCQDTFYVVDYDATRQAVGDQQPLDSSSPNNDQHYSGWQRLGFQHNGGSSFASLVGVKDRLERSRPNSVWTKLLLPPAYHGPAPGHCEGAGMNGHLPLMLALILLAYEREHARWVLENLFQQGIWLLHDRTGVCKCHQTVNDFLVADWKAGEDRRGIVIETWAWPGSSDPNRLKAFEHGPIFL